MLKIPLSKHVYGHSVYEHNVYEHNVYEHNVYGHNDIISYKNVAWTK